MKYVFVSSSSTYMSLLLGMMLHLSNETPDAIPGLDKKERKHAREMKKSKHAK